MTPEQRKRAVILDYAQELQHNDEPWREFECAYGDGGWTYCGDDINPIQQASCPAWRFRRKPKTITVTIPVPIQVLVGSNGSLVISFNDSLSNADSVTALAAIRAEMEKGRGNER